MRQTSGGVKIADMVRTHLKSKPYTIEALQNGIVNSSSLARQVQRELGLRNHQAVKAAIRRYGLELKKRNTDIEMRALPVLSGNKITLLDGIHVVIADKKLDLENDAEVKVESLYVYLTRKNFARNLGRQQQSHIVKVNEKCSAIIVYSEERIERTSGVVAFITAVLAEQNINLIEFLSCYTETIIVVNREDALRAYQILSEIVNYGLSAKAIKK